MNSNATCWALFPVLGLSGCLLLGQPSPAAEPPSLGVAGAAGNMQGSAAVPGSSNPSAARPSNWLPPPAPPPTPESSLAALTNNPLRVIAPGIFELGKVRLDQRNRTVSFPAVFNRGDVPMEYLLVASYGKTHESILKTEAMPYHIHVAMLLLGAAGAAPEALPASLPKTGGPIKDPSAAVIPGDKITIDIAWHEDVRRIHRAAEDLLLNTQTHSAPESGHWVYNGSILASGRFFAQMDGSLISLITDPVALVNFTGAGHDNDRIWLANTNHLPPANVPLEVTIKLEEPATALLPAGRAGPSVPVQK